MKSNNLTTINKALGRSVRACLPLALVILGGASAFANVTPVFKSANACVTGTGANSCSSLDGGSYNGAGFAWIYEIDLDANQTIAPTSNTLGSAGSSYGVIYDFGGVLGIPVASSLSNLAAHFTISTALSTVAPATVLPTDAGNLVNVIYQAMVGTNINGSPTGLNLGTITIISSQSGSANRQVNFVGQAVSNATGLATANIGSVIAPNLATPEPSTISFLVTGLLGAFVFGRKRMVRR